MKLNFFLLVSIILIFSGCTSISNLKEDLLFSFYSNNHITHNDKNEQIINMYNQNFRSNVVEKLSNNIFSMKYGQTGLWIPYKFLKNNGGGIYFLSEYNASLTPVLFVHGAGGNAIEWEYLINNLDYTKYQPIILSYASGVKLDFTVNIIYRHLEKLIKKYKIDKMVIIAHSMGGLVAKSLIQKVNNEKKIVKIFITLSTPWEGHISASNTKKLPYYIPSWLDMKKDSPFIHSLKDEKILNGVDHYLLFGYKGKLTLYGRDNDGTISLKSQLSDYAQKDAKKIFGFNESHISILSSKKVKNKIEIILKDKF